MGLLHLLPIEQATELDVVGVGKLVGRHQPRPDRGEAGEGLGQVVLLRRRGLELQVALGEVLADGEPGDVVPAVRFADPVRPPADDGHELNLEVHRARRQLDGVVGAGDGGGELGEDHRGGGQLEPRLPGVVFVVESDGEDLAGAGHRRAGNRRLGVARIAFGFDLRLSACPVIVGASFRRAVALP